MLALDVGGNGFLLRGPPQHALDLIDLTQRGVRGLVGLTLRHGGQPLDLHLGHAGYALLLFLLHLGYLVGAEEGKLLLRLGGRRLALLLDLLLEELQPGLQREFLRTFGALLLDRRGRRDGQVGRPFRLLSCREAGRSPLRLDGRRRRGRRGRDRLRPRKQGGLRGQSRFLEKDINKFSA